MTETFYIHSNLVALPGDVGDETTLTQKVNERDLDVGVRFERQVPHRRKSARDSGGAS